MSKLQQLQNELDATRAQLAAVQARANLRIAIENDRVLLHGIGERPLTLYKHVDSCRTYRPDVFKAITAQ